MHRLGTTSGSKDAGFISRAHPAAVMVLGVAYYSAGGTPAILHIQVARLTSQSTRLINSKKSRPAEVGSVRIMNDYLLKILCVDVAPSFEIVSR